MKETGKLEWRKIYSWYYNIYRYKITVTGILEWSETISWYYNPYICRVTITGILEWNHIYSCITVPTEVEWK